MKSVLGATALGVAALLTGCGGGEDYVYEVENPDTPEVVYAKEVRMRLEEMKQANDAEGPGSVDTIGYLEGMEGYGDDPPVGENAAVYQEITAGVKEIQGMIEAGKSRAEVSAKIDELLAKVPEPPAPAAQ